MMLGLHPPPGKVNTFKVRRFFSSVPQLDVVICTKTTDIALARKYSPGCKVIWWHLGIDKFNRRAFKKAVNASSLIAYTGAVTYKYVYDRLMPEPFPTPVLIAHGPYDISRMETSFRDLRSDQIRSRHGIAADEIVILHVGGARPEKGYEVATASLKMIEFHNSPVVRFVSIGHGENSVTYLSENLIIDKREILTLEEVFSFYKIADIGLVIPLWKEPGPAVFVEMLFFETAVIASYEAGVPEMMSKNPECALPVYQPNSILSWSQSISQLIENEGLRESLSEKGRRHAIDFFKEPVIENWSKAINSLKNTG